MQQVEIRHAAQSFEYELDWMRHADGYLAAVHHEMAKNPADAEMHALLLAMTAAIASRTSPVVQARI